MQTFPLPVKASMDDSWSRPTRIIKFGDGYSERSPDGLNRADETWNVECAFASEVAGANLQAFLNTVGGWEAFLWQSPRDIEPQTYIIVQPVGGAVRRGGGSKPYFYTRSLKFKRTQESPQLSSNFYFKSTLSSTPSTAIDTYIMPLVCSGTTFVRQLN